MRNFTGQGSNLVPRIVEREEAVDLQELVYNAIDRGRIAALKPSAAKQVADALCEQIGMTLQEGRGVRFGKYFYVRNYLTGKLESVNGTTQLTDANQIRTRLIAGEDLKLSLDMFNWVNDGAGDAAKIENILADLQGALDNEIVRGTGFNVIGRNLQLSSTSTATITYGEGEEATTINISPTVNGDELVKFAWPAALADVAAGTELTVTFNYADEDGNPLDTITHKATLVVQA